MKRLTIGKLRGLQQISSDRGTFTALALDHRQNLRKANPIFASDEQLSRFKLDVTSVLAPYATAVLLDPEVSARRAAQLAKVAESAEYHSAPRYIIGTEVPVPGGATEHEDGVSVTHVKDVEQTTQVTREAFLREGLAEAWERVIGVVVQPGVEFGDNFVLEYQPEKTKELSRFVESQPMIYEAHSTDYQTGDALKNLVRDHFAILKVGPGLTFAFREAVFALAMMEDGLFSKDMRSNLIQVLDDVMMQYPEHWKKYYHGDEAERAFKRKYSLSDRARYYWV